MPCQSIGSMQTEEVAVPYSTSPYSFTAKQSNAFYIMEHCFLQYKAMLYRGIELCFEALKVMLFN
jgi:hypothetical protein